MFAYCNNNPINAVDPSGHALVYVSVGFYDDPTRYMFFGGGGGGGGGSICATVAMAAESIFYFIENPHHEGALETKTSTADLGTKTGRILPWEITFLSLEDGITIVDASIAVLDAIYQLPLTEHLYAEVVLLRAFSLEGSAKITVKDGVELSALASMASSDLSFGVGRFEITLTGYLGAVGAKAGYSIDSITLGYAKFVGGSVSVKWN